MGSHSPFSRGDHRWRSFERCDWLCGIRLAAGGEDLSHSTTLAAIDAAWGGKTALNWKKVKNQIGTIHPPVAVHIDARWLTTLPEREFRAGLAEAAKHAMIDSKSLSISPPPTLAAPQSDQDVTRWNDWLHRSADLKMKVVAQDLNDHGIRNQLNLGHTVGHALESHFAKSDSPWLHGGRLLLVCTLPCMSLNTQTSPNSHWTISIKRNVFK